VVIIFFFLADLWIWYFNFKKETLRLTFLDVGQGDACLVELPNDQSFLIDTGPCTENYDAGLRTIIPYLKRRNIKKLNAIFISHVHNDHSGGLRSLGKNDNVDFVFTVDVKPKNPHEDFISFCDSLDIAVHYLCAGDYIEKFPPVKIQILSPFSFMLENPSIFNENENSLVMRMVYGKHTFLFCGDIEKQTEQILLKYDFLLQSNVLKSPHHGSKTSNTSPFLQRIDPDWAVISVGKWNRFNHPSRTVLKRFKDQNIQFIRTDEDGAVIIISDGYNLRRIR
jgi:competence protein ComEC